LNHWVSRALKYLVMPSDCFLGRSLTIIKNMKNSADTILEPDYCSVNLFFELLPSVSNREGNRSIPETTLSIATPQATIANTR
jgi:hypothetical protein